MAFRQYRTILWRLFRCRIGNNQSHIPWPAERTIGLPFQKLLTRDQLALPYVSRTRSGAELVFFRPQACRLGKIFHFVRFADLVSNFRFPASIDFRFPVLQLSHANHYLGMRRLC